MQLNTTGEPTHKMQVKFCAPVEVSVLRFQAAKQMETLSLFEDGGTSESHQPHRSYKWEQQAVCGIWSRSLHLPPTLPQEISCLKKVLICFCN
jgi:hypothetical protein